MSHIVMASPSKSLTTPSLSPQTSKPKPTPKPAFLPKFPILPKTLTLTLLKSTLTVSATTAATLLLPHAAVAAEIEKASLFDFNLTLPIIMAEFLVLMFALDKIYYTPLGDFMDRRDAEIKGKLADVKDTSGEVKQLEEQANAVMRAARAEIAAALNKMKKETQVEVEAMLAEGRKKVEAELQEALSSLEKQKEDTIAALDSQISALSDDIVKKVLPVSK
ncbi:hypothetical protein RND81_08G205200 [Saponaria officinalis]|uniref:ATP synthase subunit b', chloroplastic n=1 Tax=Saponaria officinalis TaxID=3572 RepID=A0AAW1JC89_SAPOF